MAPRRRAVFAAFLELRQLVAWLLLRALRPAAAGWKFPGGTPYNARPQLTRGRSREIR